MKKLYIICFLLISITSYAQLSENFDASTSLPAGWTSFIGTNGIGTSFNWETSTVRYYSPGNSAFVRYENVTGGPAEDWLVTPLIDLTNYTGSSLSFYGGQQYTDPYATQYFIRVSTTSATDIASFTTLATYAESDFSGIAGGAPLLPSDLKTVDLSAYDGQQIYLAFVMIQDDGDNWFIDDVNVSGTLSIRDLSTNQIAVFPNPTSGIINVSSKSTVSFIEVYDVLGKWVLAVENSNRVDLSALAKGAYIARITTADGKIKNQKIIKN